VLLVPTVDDGPDQHFTAVATAIVCCPPWLSPSVPAVSRHLDHAVALTAHTFCRTTASQPTGRRRPNLTTGDGGPGACPRLGVWVG
jgi:hypothetical protein